MKNIPVKLPFLLLLFAIGVLTRLPGQSTVGLNIDSGSFTLNNYGNTTPLAVGDVLQFGYYTGATTSNPFAGTWVALTGNGGANSGLSFTEIGGNPINGAGVGTFAYTTSDITFTLGSATTGADLPSAGQIMAIRYYNGTTVASSTAFGAASDASWLWIAPAQTPFTSMSFSLDDPGVGWLGNDVAFTGVPEPSSVLLLGLGLILLPFTYRKWRKSAEGTAAKAVSAPQRTHEPVN